MKVVNVVKFGVEFIPQDPFWRTVFYVAQAEKGGFDNTWITDHFMNRNPYTTMAAIALYTERITMGVGVTNPYLVNPVVTAQNIASLSEIAPNRVILGIGAGDKTTLGFLGVETSLPVRAVRECVEIARALLSGEKVKNYEGKIFKIRKAKLAFKPVGKIPIYIGAQGPMMLKLAAKIGDGVLINASHPEDVKEAMAHIRKGAEKVGRDLSGFDVVVYTSFSTHKEREKARKAALPVVAFIVAGCPPPLLEKHGISLEKATKLKNALNEGKWDEAFSSVTDDMMESFSICGTPEECSEKIAEMFELGVTQFVMGSPIGPKVHKAIDTISKEIIPRFK